MIARFSAALALSVLLHGLVLWAFNPRAQPGAVRRGGDRPMSVRFAPAQRIEASLVVRPKRPAVPPEKKPMPTAPAQAAVPAASLPLPGFSGSAWGRPFAPDIQQQVVQMNYRQMYEARLRQRAVEQARFEAVRLQQEIGQRLQQNSDHATGQCRWRGIGAEDAGAYQCEPEALARLMQADTDRLLALRKAMRVQGLVLDGFAVSRGEREAITYQVRPLANASAQ